MKHLGTYTLLIGILATFSVSTAKALDWPGNGAPGLRLLRALIDLDIQPEQKQEFAKIVRSARESVRPQVDAVIEARKALFSTINVDQFNEQQVRDAAKNVAAAEEELAVSRARVMSKARSVLTAEQKEKLEGYKIEIGQRIESRIAEIREMIDSWADSQS